MTYLLLAATVTPSEQNFSREAGRETGETQRGGGRGKGKPLEPLGFSLWCPGPGLGAGLEAGISLGGWAMIGIGAGFFTAMAKDILGEAGLHFDELNKLRVLDPEVTQQTIELKEECKDFVDSECRVGRHGAFSLELFQLCPTPTPDCSSWPWPL